MKRNSGGSRKGRAAAGEVDRGAAGELKNVAAIGDCRYTPCQREFLAQRLVERATFEAQQVEGSGGFSHFDAVAGFDADAVAAIDGENHRPALAVLGRELDDGII